MAANDRYLEHLGSIALFSALSRKELERVARSADELHVKAGHKLVTQGDVGREMFVIVDGTASVHRNDQHIGTIGPGAAVGELSLLDHGPRTASVVCDTDCTVLVLGVREFTALLDDVPDLNHKLLTRLAAWVRELDTKVYG
ncbi:MAG TPA: cyclic nucleotide-binding domain-containing protein [Acidimicrobiales bacterium]|nr:cyclic nucleotide-binding domain-containing protein [Acidimicrobiales bacterium]